MPAAPTSNKSLRLRRASAIKRTGKSPYKQNTIKKSSKATQAAKSAPLPEILLPEDRRLPAVSAENVDQLRRRVFRLVDSHLRVVPKVLAGTVHWNTVQQRLFLALLNKVVPDISHKTVHSVAEHRDVRELSLDELQAIAMRGALTREARVELSTRALFPADADAKALDPDDLAHSLDLAEQLLRSADPDPADPADPADPDPADPDD